MASYLPILLIAGAAAIAITASKKKKPASKVPDVEEEVVEDEDECPSNFAIDMSPEFMAALDDATDAAIGGGSREAFKVADIAFGMVVPPECSKSDFESIVRMPVNESVGGDGALSATTNVAVLYGLLVWSAANKLLAANLIGQVQMGLVRTKILDNYMRLTGTGFPQRLV